MNQSSGGRNHEDYNQTNARTIHIRGLEHSAASDALVELNFSGDRAISIAGRFFTVDEAEYRRLQEDGIQPTTWHHHEATGCIISVPGKH